MSVLMEENAPKTVTSSLPRVKLRMLEQMAEALEDQVAALYRRAATFEEEEFLLNREIEDRQTEINRLLLKLETTRTERDRIMDKIESISREAKAMREEVFNHEEEVALSSIDGSKENTEKQVAASSEPVFTGGDPSRSAMFFRRMIVSEAVTKRLEQ